MKDYFFILFLSLAVVAGCESKTEVSNLQTGEENSSDSVVDQAADQETSDGQSEKVAATEMPEADASPDQVCRIFMNLLRDENTESANRLFTRKARVLTMQYDLPLTFPGESNDRFSVGDAKFATSKEELAQVVCKIEGTDDQDSSSEIGWMLKRGAHGWRICGMLLPLAEGEPVMDFISFENASDLDRIKALLTSDLDGNNNLQAIVSPAIDSTQTN